MTLDGNPLRSWAAIAAVAAVQTAILAWMVWDRVSLLRSGREVVVDVVPVDPRSLFRGDYVRFSYDFARIDKEVRDVTLPGAGNPIFVLLEQTGDGKWKILKAAATAIAGADDRHVLLKGQIQRGWTTRHPDSRPIDVRYGIESYFVPEGEGRELEKLVREKRISVILAVGRDGTAAIKGILADGKPIVREKPL